MNKIKSCPFCGKAEPVECVESIEYKGHFYVICHLCEIRTFIFDTPQKAIKRWNRRAKNE